MSSRTRAALVLTVVAALASMLTSCTADPAPAAAPQVGECRSYSVPVGAQHTDESATKDCALPHSAETFAVADALPSLGGAGVWSDAEVRAAGRSACTHDAAARWLGMDLAQYERLRLPIVWFVPGKEQVSSGAHWIRCDVELVDRGTAVQVAGLFGPRARDEGVFVSCATDPQTVELDGFRCVPGLDVYAAAASSAPGTVALTADGDNAAKQQATSSCGEAVRRVANISTPSWQTVYPTAAQWRAGQQFAVCWIRLRDWGVDPSRWPVETAVSAAPATPVPLSS